MHNLSVFVAILKMDQSFVFNPVQHQIMNPKPDEPVYYLPAVQEHEENIKRRDFQSYIIPTAYDLLPPEKIKEQAQKIFYGR